jgi:hypothetical protein
VCVAHFADREGRVGDAGDVDEAGERGEELRVTSEMMVEGVVGDREGAVAIDRRDRFGRFALEAQ